MLEVVIGNVMRVIAIFWVLFGFELNGKVNQKSKPSVQEIFNGLCLFGAVSVLFLVCWKDYKLWILNGIAIGYAFILAHILLKIFSKNRPD